MKKTFSVLATIFICGVVFFSYPFEILATEKVVMPPPLMKYVSPNRDYEVFIKTDDRQAMVFKTGEKEPKYTINLYLSRERNWPGLTYLSDAGLFLVEITHYDGINPDKPVIALYNLGKKTLNWFGLRELMSEDWIKENSVTQRVITDFAGRRWIHPSFTGFGSTGEYFVIETIKRDTFLLDLQKSELIKRTTEYYGWVLESSPGEAIWPTKKVVSSAEALIEQYELTREEADFLCELSTVTIEIPNENLLRFYPSESESCDAVINGIYIIGKFSFPLHFRAEVQNKKMFFPFRPTEYKKKAELLTEAIKKIQNEEIEILEVRLTPSHPYGWCEVCLAVTRQENLFLVILPGKVNMQEVDWYEFKIDDVFRFIELLEKEGFQPTHQQTWKGKAGVLIGSRGKSLSVYGRDRTGYEGEILYSLRFRSLIRQ